LKYRVFMVTSGEEKTFLAIRKIASYTPVHYELTVWYNLMDGELDRPFYSQLRDQTDDVIMCSENKGITVAEGFALLYLDYDQLILTYSDIMVTPDYFTKLMEPFQTIEKVGIVGEEHGRMPNRKFDGFTCDLSNPIRFPDGILMAKKGCVDDIGSVSPAFKVYGHSLTELCGRAVAKGWKVIGVKDVISEDTKEVSETLPDREVLVGANTEQFLSAKDGGFKGYNWWKNNLGG